MAFKMKGFPLRETEPTLPEGAEGTNVLGAAVIEAGLTDKQKARLAELNKALSGASSGISEAKWQSMTTERANLRAKMKNA